MEKIKVKAEGRKDIWIPIDKDNLKKWISGKKFEVIHNFIPNGMMIIGADHDVEGVLLDIDKSDRIALFTDSNANMGHSLALIYEEKLECYDIGKITEEDLEII
jgi:hypothetical protein